MNLWLDTLSLLTDWQAIHFWKTKPIIGATMLLTPPPGCCRTKKRNIKVNARCGPVINIINSQWYAWGTKIQSASDRPSSSSSFLLLLYWCHTSQFFYWTHAFLPMRRRRWRRWCGKLSSTYNVITENFTLYWSLFLPRDCSEIKRFTRVWQNVPAFRHLLALNSRRSEEIWYWGTFDADTK